MLIPGITKKCECVNCQCFTCKSRNMHQARNTKVLGPNHFSLYDIWTCKDCGANHEEQLEEKNYGLIGLALSKE